MSDIIAPGTVAHEVLQFLRANAGEEFSTSEIAAGTGRSTKRMPQHLAPALRAGILARRIDNGFAFWRLGPNADKSQPPNIAFDEKTVVKVSALAAPSVFAYADQRRAAPFSAAAHTDGRVATERHGRVIAEFTAMEVAILKKALGMLS